MMSSTSEEVATQEARLACSSSRFAIWLCLAALFGQLTLQSRGALQFDVFIGYGGQSSGFDGVVREASWFPVVCEVFNDGPPFKAVVELSAGRAQASAERRIVIELPTNTRKRFVIPVFAVTGRYSNWDARLLDEQGTFK